MGYSGCQWGCCLLGDSRCGTYVGQGTISLDPVAFHALQRVSISFTACLGQDYRLTSLLPVP